MTERERLIEILLDGVTFTDQYKNTARMQAEYTADHILANGVIVPPCKAGDVVYVLDDFIWACDCGECEHFEEGWYDSPHECRKTRTSRKAPECIEIVERTVAYKDILQYMNWDDFGKTVFLSREDAEKALKERSEGK